MIRNTLAALGAAALYYLCYPPLLTAVFRLEFEHGLLALAPVDWSAAAIWGGYLLTAGAAALAAAVPAAALLALAPPASFSTAVLIGVLTACANLAEPLLFMFYTGWAPAVLWWVRLLEFALIALAPAAWLLLSGARSAAR